MGTYARKALVPVIALAALVLAPSSAGAVTFGANLNRTPNNTITCGDFQSPYYSAATFNSCSWEFTHLGTGESVFPPVGLGRITQVRVRVGPVTGPMQIVVEEALRKDNPSDPGHPTYACCKAINLSQVFTPTANAITTVNVNLPVRQDAAPDPASGFYVDDHLALSVLARNVPIPANADSGASDGGWFPAWRLGQERTGAYGTSGYVILFNAEWNRASSAPGTGGSLPGGAGTNLVDVARGTATVRGRFAYLRLVCRLTTLCEGNVRLQRLFAGDATASRRKRATYGKRRFRIKAGKKKTIKVKLTRKGRRLMRRRRRARVRVRMKLGKGNAARIYTSKVKLKRARRRRR